MSELKEKSPQLKEKLKKISKTDPLAIFCSLAGLAVVGFSIWSLATVSDTPDVSAQPFEQVEFKTEIREVIINIGDFGAVSADSISDKEAIEQAIDAARALARSNKHLRITIVIPDSIYTVPTPIYGYGYSIPEYNIVPKLDR